MSDLLYCAAVLASALLIRVLLFSLSRIKGRSMLPTLENGDWVFVWRLPYLFRPPRRGEVVICHFPGRRLKRLPFLPQDFVKRIIGCPEETLEVFEGELHINGAVISEPYLDPARCRFLRNRPPVTLGKGDYYVLGDNRDASNDSRRIGSLRRRAIRGRVVAILWPPRRMGPVR